jgi:hypothetical protein
VLGDNDYVEIVVEVATNVGRRLPRPGTAGRRKPTGEQLAGA